MRLLAARARLSAVAGPDFPSRLKKLLKETITAFARPQPGTMPPRVPTLPPDRRRAVAEALAKPDGARDALLIVLGYRLAYGTTVNLGNRLPGDRSVSRLSRARAAAISRDRRSQERLGKSVFQPWVSVD